MAYIWRHRNKATIGHLGAKKMFNKLMVIWVLVVLLCGVALLAGRTTSPSTASVVKPEITLEDYKTQARTISYDNLARNPQDYLRTIVKLEGKVIQAGHGFLRVDVEAHISWVDRPNMRSAVVYVSYRPKDNDRILEGDKVRFWGR